MGDRIECARDCIYCGETEEGIWFAPTCGSMTFKCKKCKKENFITTDLEVKKIEDATYDDVYFAISNASNMMDEKMIKSCAKEFFEDLKKKRKKK